MTSTTSKVIPHVITAYLTMIVLALVVGCLQGCAEPQAPATKTRIVTTSSQAETQEPTKPPPVTDRAAPAEKSDDEDKKEPPYFGSTYFDELLTSVYYYPGETKADQPVTHLKFNHREDQVYLCGDQRRSFEPGTRIRLVVTFEPNAPCITNWKVK